MKTSSKHKLLLHACCAPCSTWPYEKLRNFYDITLYFYNPNIYPLQEFFIRRKEFILLSRKLKIPFIYEEYSPQDFFYAAKGHETDSEGGERCSICFNLRLEKTAQYASKNNFALFGTTLSISPHKNTEKINYIGKKLSEKYSIKFLEENFKSGNGFKKSCKKSREYKLYRQKYCGCCYSLMKRKGNMLAKKEKTV